MSVAPTSATAVESAVAAATRTCAAAEKALHRARAVRSRSATALERTAQRRGCDEAERERLRAAYAAADSAVVRCQADLDRARALEQAWVVVAGSLDTSAAAELFAAPTAGDAEGGVVRARTRASRTIIRRSSIALARSAQPRPA